jgi:orotate phosphoribosyltransferase
MNLFQVGEFTLHSGKPSKWKIDCDALTDEDWSALAQLAVKVVGPFGTVMTPGGASNRFAKALLPFATMGPILIADDVLTSGSSMWGMLSTITDPHRRGRAKGVVIFARGPCPNWVKPLFKVPEELWAH